MAPSQKFAELLMQEAKEIFKRLDKELREEREQEFASKVSKANNKIKYVSKVPELKAVEVFSKVNKEVQDKEVRDKVYKLLDKYAELTGDFSKSSYTIKKRIEDESNLNDGGNKEEDEEFTKINDSFYIKYSSIIAIYNYPFGDNLTRIILEGGEKIDIHVWSQDIFKLLNKCKKDFIKIDDTYIKPNFVTTVFKSIRDDCTVIIALLKYGGEIIFPATRFYNINYFCFKWIR